MRIFVLKLPPGQHLGEAEEHEGGEGVSGFAADETEGRDNLRGFLGCKVDFESGHGGFSFQ